ncbi:rCG35431, isoform CRA_b [Rattus norvegicus]|uniref:RCG35431, isoform CRA_b n=1 Tax=Rattus norvegicus TaxID=10116 RepID=A6HG12_RAT|nr:rCG35431, isoform CRA_b [Rattus norvegicus]
MGSSLVQLDHSLTHSLLRMTVFPSQVIASSPLSRSMVLTSAMPVTNRLPLP